MKNSSLSLSLALLLTLACLPAAAQDTLRLDLSTSLQMASQQSVAAYRAKNIYRAGYWRYRSFRAGRLPQLWLNLEPFTFRRSTTSRYDSEQNIDIYREQRNVNNYASLEARQTLPFSGGRIFVDSDLGRLANFGDNSLITYSATWLRVGVEQPIWGFNEQKWESRQQPLQYEQQRRNYLALQQQIAQQVVDLYFGLLLSEVQLEAAQRNRATTDTLYKMGVQRSDIMAISREELLNLELNRFNAEVDILRAAQERDKALFRLNSFLGLDPRAQCRPLLPPLPQPAPLSYEQALELVRKNNPSLLGTRLDRLAADRSLEQTTRSSRFQADLRASVGLNQYDQTLPGAYQDPLNQQIVSLSLRIPLVDWGQNRGARLMAQSQREVAHAEASQTENDLQQELLLKLQAFQLQPRLVESAQRAREVAAGSYALAHERFVGGKATVLELTTAMQNNQLAQEKYLQAVYTYWRYYFDLQALTLCDLSTGIDLTTDFDTLVNE